MIQYTVATYFLEIWNVYILEILLKINNLIQYMPNNNNEYE